jgi:hypothetical protein
MKQVNWHNIAITLTDLPAGVLSVIAWLHKLSRLLAQPGFSAAGYFWFGRQLRQLQVESVNFVGTQIANEESRAVGSYAAPASGGGSYVPEQPL